MVSSQSQAWYFRGDLLLEGVLAGLRLNILLLYLVDLCRRRAHIQVLHKLLQSVVISLSFTNDLILSMMGGNDA